MASTSSGETFPCVHCPAVFVHRTHRNRHVRQKHEIKMLHQCPLCGKEFARKDDSDNHLRACHNKPTKRKQPAERRPHPRPKRSKEATGQERVNTEEEEPEIRELYSRHRDAIRTHERIGVSQSMYNIQRLSQSTPQWDAQLLDIFNRQQSRFKINLSHSFILSHREQEKHRFFHASQNNNRVFDRPRLINNKEDFLSFLAEIRETDALEHARQERPDSKWTVHSIAATSFYINPISDFPIGCGAHTLPEHLRKNSAIITLQSSRKDGTRYNDNLCFFRCLALHQGASIRALQTPTQHLFQQWTPSPRGSFSGITMTELDRAEQIFRTNVDVFEWDEEKECLVPARRSGASYNTTMRILHHDGHFCYISDINKAARAFGCPKCGKLWKEERPLKRHEQTCTGDGIRQVYPGGVYHPSPSPLEILEKNGLLVDTAFVFPYRATYDFEVYFDSATLPPQTSKTKYTAKHIPLSGSVSSNVPCFEEPVCFISDGNPQDLVDKMVDYLESISDHAYLLLREDFSDVFQQLDEREEEGEANTTSSLPAKELRAILETYLQEMPVVGFNSAKYDLNVIKPFLIKRFVQEELTNPLRFVIQRQNEFMCIFTSKLKFLDVMNFIAPGFSYSKYLAAFDVKEEKGFFPYEFITGLTTLEMNHLPSKQAFFSSLRNEHISDRDYAYCQRVWVQHDMKTLRDFLTWYNNKDVAPFLEALEKQSEFYRGLNLDMLKDAISVPGLTLRYLFKTLSSDTYFSLVHEKQKNIHQLMREQVVGGPSIIFHRHHEKGVTHLRGPDGKTVDSLLGFDANALYLWALMQPMPTAHPTRRRKETGFKAEKVDRFGQLAREWLEWTMQQENIHLQHKFNDKERRLGRKRIPVDGWDALNDTVYQFHGCIFHGHSCYKTLGIDINPLNGTALSELKKNTEDITGYLRDEVGVRVVEMWECEWENEKRRNQRIQPFLDQRFPVLKPFHGEITKEKILEAVEKGKLFGLVQCDIEVPDHLREYFSEMPPIFKNTEISREDVGDFMRSYAERHRLLSQPRRTLISSYFGKGILLTTPLLTWYLHHGLRVTEIHQVIEYQPRRCFQRFGETVSNARREGDRDSSKAILADTFKLLGNSAYGKTLTNLEKHRRVSYVDEKKAQKLVNDSAFRKLTPLTEDIVEVECAKRNVRWNLPLQIGYFVYQYAKLRMLEFHYDFIDKYVSRSDYQLCEMDTDSLYMALSTSTLDDAVRPDLLPQFYQERSKWLPAQSCDAHQRDFVVCRLSKQPWRPSSSCCVQRQSFDKRTPGLFKVEFQGNGIVALCSKTYYCFGNTNVKTSCKGLNKRLNDLTKDTYLRVLQTQTNEGGVNRGFRTDGRTVHTYEQRRDSLSFFYIKRRVQEDGITTKPLFI